LGRVLWGTAPKSSISQAVIMAGPGGEQSLLCHGDLKALSCSRLPTVATALSRYMHAQSLTHFGGPSESYWLTPLSTASTASTKFLYTCSGQHMTTARTVGGMLLWHSHDILSRDAGQYTQSVVPSGGGAFRKVLDTIIKKFKRAQGPPHPTPCLPKTGDWRPQPVTVYYIHL